MKVILSNRLEILFNHLKEHLFSDSDPFSKRIVIVPSEVIHAWITQEIASDPSLKVAMGIRFLFLDEALSLFSTFRFPSELELIFMIEKEISEIVQQQDPLWRPLVNYLKGREARIFPLCQKLAHLFRRYAIYGREVYKKWDPPTEWQQGLWNRLFSNREFSFEPTKIAKKTSVHLFSLSHLSSRHFSFFKKLSSHCPTLLYHLSPCQEFWSDLRSDSELEFYFKKTGMSEKARLAFEEVLEERLPCLANLGRVAREFAYLVEENDLETFEDYRDPSLEGSTQLLSFQHELLTLKKGEAKNDLSLQVHCFHTPYREIEGLYHILVTLLSEKKLEPKDVIVMAPDITLYEPFIRAIFGETKGLDCQILDLPLVSKSPLLTALFLLLDLENRRFEASALFELFTHPLFQKKQGWKEKELEQIKKWVTSGKIRWGVDLEHAKTIVGEGFRDEKGTWEGGFRHLLVDFATHRPLGFETASLLGEVIEVLRSLYEDLKRVNSERFSMEMWSEVLKALALSYFECKEEEIEELLSLNISSGGKAYLFETIWPLLKEILGRKKITWNPHALQTIKFCSCLPMRAIPAKVIALIGMNHESFPRKETLHSLDLLAFETHDYTPSRLDLDRSFFLEALLSARDTLLISYQGRSPFDQSELPPSSLVAQLIHSLSLNVIHHPDFSFDPLYFSDPILKNTSPLDFERSLALFTEPPSSSSAEFFIGSPEESFKIPQGRHVVRIKDLLNFTRAPLRLYFQKNLKIFLSEKKGEEEFTLSPLSLAKIKREALKHTSDELFSKIKENLAQNSFFEANCRLIQKEIEQLQTLLKSHDLSPLHSKTIFKEIDYDEQTTFEIIGEIDFVSSQALLANEKCTFEGAIRMLPTYLILNPLKIVFAKDGETRTSFLENSEPSLRKLLHAYFLASHTPCPLFPSWIEAILKRDEKRLIKAMKEEIYSQELTFLLKNRVQLNAESIFQKWGKLAEELYSDLKKAWF